MSNLTVALVIGCVGAVSACGSAPPSAISADIAKVSEVKSAFGAGFQLTDVGPTGLDPRLLAVAALPAGLTFDPVQCAAFAVSQQLPAGIQGNMAAVTAEGDGNRFITIALETSEPVPFVEPGRGCQKVAFTGPGIRGLVEVVEVPEIPGADTLGVHRIIQAVADGQPRTGEIYNYSAHFGSFQVLVVANPLVQPDRPVVAVDTARARDLLVAAVSAVRG